MKIRKGPLKVGYIVNTKTKTEKEECFYFIKMHSKSV